MYEKVVRHVDIFKDLTQPQIDELYTWLERRDFPANTDIIREGSSPDGLYLLVEGTVAVVKTSSYGRFKLTDIDGPSFFGEMGLLSAAPRTAGVKSVTPVVTGFLPFLTYRGKLVQNNITALRIALNIGELLCERLAETSDALAAKTAVMAKRRAVR